MATPTENPIAAAVVPVTDGKLPAVELRGFLKLTPDNGVRLYLDRGYRTYLAFKADDIIIQVPAIQGDPDATMDLVVVPGELLVTGARTEYAWRFAEYDDHPLADDPGSGPPRKPTWPRF